MACKFIMRWISVGKASSNSMRLMRGIVLVLADLASSSSVLGRKVTPLKAFVLKRVGVRINLFKSSTKAAFTLLASPLPFA